MVRARLNLVSDAPVPGPGSLPPARRWTLSRSANSAHTVAAAAAATTPAPRSYLSFFSRTLTVVVVGVAATYAATKYAFARIADIQRGISAQRRDSENLRRRFAQNQEDCTFTVLALLPTLDSVLGKTYDVDAITRELSAKPAAQAQTQAQASQPAVPAIEPASAAEAAPEPQADNEASKPQLEEDGTKEEPVAAVSELAESTLSSAPVDLSTSAIQKEMEEATAAQPQDPQAAISNGAATESATDNNPAVPPSAPTSAEPAAAENAEAVQTESSPAAPPADETAAPTPATESTAAEPSVPASTSEAAGLSRSAGAAPAVPAAPASTSADLAPSTVLGESAVLVEAPQQLAAPQAPALSPEELLALKRRKAELWHELKITAFTRTLTTLYSIVLLSLQTHIQLNLVGRFNYLSSVTAIARATSSEEDALPQAWAAATEKSSIPASFAEVVEQARAAEADPNELLRSVEQRYLTYSWWLLHRGALQIGQEVETAVKHVLGTVPLKAELSLAELHRLVREVRRVVEWERVPLSATTQDLEKSLVLSADPSAQVASSPSSSSPSSSRRKRRRHFLSAMFPQDEQGEREILAQAGVPTSAESELLHVFDELEYTSSAEAEQSRAHARAQRAREDAQLAALVDESKDWIDSDDFERVLALCLERVFGIWEANLAEGAFGGSAILRQGSDEAERERLLEELSRPRKVRLAALLPAVNAQSRLATQSVPNEYAEAVADVKELRALSALIYSAWST